MKRTILKHIYDGYMKVFVARGKYSAIISDPIQQMHKSKWIMYIECTEQWYYSEDEAAHTALAKLYFFYTLSQGEWFLLIGHFFLLTKKTLHDNPRDIFLYCVVFIPFFSSFHYCSSLMRYTALLYKTQYKRENADKMRKCRWKDRCNSAAQEQHAFRNLECDWWECNMMYCVLLQSAT